MNIEVYKYEKIRGVHTFYLVIPDLNVKTYIAFDQTELRMNPKIHQIKTLFKIRIENGILDMLEFIQEREITKFIVEHIETEDIFLKMLVMVMEPSLAIKL